MLFLDDFLGLATVAKLIGCDIENLKLALSTRNMKVRNENIVQRLTLSQVCLEDNFFKNYTHAGCDG